LIMASHPMYEPFKSSNPKKKYDVFVFKNAKKVRISFGSREHQHYKDTTKARAWSSLDHGDEKRRLNYIKRATKIKNKKGQETALILSSPNYYSLKYLWSYVPGPRTPYKTKFKKGYLYNEK
jgi:hypothetical protein